MNTTDIQNESILKDLVVLVVDDEQDIADAIGEELDMCIIDKAIDYTEASQLLLSYTYDAVVLDIVGVNGFELLKIATSRGFPTIVVTAHAITEDVQDKSTKLGAISLLPKEKMGELKDLLSDTILASRKS